MMRRRATEAKNILLKLVCAVDSYKIRLIEKAVFSYAVKHLVCSDLDRIRLATIFPSSDIVVVPNGIDCSKIILDRAPVLKSLLFIGGLDWYPNVDAIRYFLNEIWPLLSIEFPDLTFDIVGKCPPSDLVSRYQHDRRIKFHGFVNDISDFYRKSWIYVCPIMDGGGTKLKVLDAMANGVLLIAHPVAMEGIDAEPGTHYFPVTTVNDYIEIIQKLSAEKEADIHDMESAARALILSKYNYEKIGLTLAESY
jgi:glycosyltransferase involved in cell wall biosynthesis